MQLLVSKKSDNALNLNILARLIDRAVLVVVF